MFLRLLCSAADYYQDSGSRYNIKVQEHQWDGIRVVKDVCVEEDGLLQNG